MNLYAYCVLLVPFQQIKINQNVRRQQAITPCARQRAFLDNPIQPFTFQKRNVRTVHQQSFQQDSYCPGNMLQLGRQIGLADTHKRKRATIGFRAAALPFCQPHTHRLRGGASLDIQFLIGRQSTVMQSHPGENIKRNQRTHCCALLRGRCAMQLSKYVALQQRPELDGVIR